METTAEWFILGPFLFGIYACIAILLLVSPVLAWDLAVKWKRKSPRQRLWDFCLLTALLTFAISLASTMVNMHLNLAYGGETVRGDVDSDKFFVKDRRGTTPVSKRYYRLKSRIETLAFCFAPFGFIASFSVFIAQAIRQQREKTLIADSCADGNESDRSRDSEKRE